MWPPSHLPVRNRYSAMPTLTPGWAEFWRGCDWVQRAWILVTCPHSLHKLLWEPGEQIKSPERKGWSLTLSDGKAPPPHLLCQLPPPVCCFWSQPHAHLWAAPLWPTPDSAHLSAGYPPLKELNVRWEISQLIQFFPGREEAFLISS